MMLALVIASISLILAAFAIELWWGVHARRVQDASLERVEERIRSRAPPVSPQAPAQASPTTTGTRTTATGLPWDDHLQSADLPTGWKLPLGALALGLALSVAAAARIGTPWMIVVTLPVFAGVVLFWIHRRTGKVRQRLLAQLPDFLENMVRLTALGNSLPAAFQTASTQVAPPLRELLDDTLRSARGGMDFERAFAAAARPYRLQALEVLAVVMGVCMRVGGRADHILQRMSDFMRDLVQAQQELRATTSETRASAWVLGMLPPLSALFMALMSPDFFQPLFTSAIGYRIVAIAIVLEVVGVLLLYRLAKSL